MLKPLLLPEQVCDILHCTKDWLYDQVQAGNISCVRMGQRLRFTEEHIQQYIERQSQPTAAA